MTASPPLLIDTTSLLRARLDRFDRLVADDAHVVTLIEALILFDSILLDGPSVERNSNDLQWLSEIDSGIELLKVSPEEEAALYKSAGILARQMRPSASDRDFMWGHMPRLLGREIEPHGFAPSTYWGDLKQGLRSEDLRNLQEVFEQVFGSAVPHSGAAFVAMARAFYYLCLQESVRSSLLLDPTKQFEQGDLEKTRNARRILDLFDHEVVEAYRERKLRWLGEQPRRIRLPLLAGYISGEAQKRGWSFGRVIVSMRESREVEFFRRGLDELQDALENGDATALDGIFSSLDAAAAAWSKQLGVGYKHSDVVVSVSLPFIGIARTLPLPHLLKHSTASKLLVFIGRLLEAPE